MANSSIDETVVYISWTQNVTKSFLFYATLVVTPIGLLFNFIQILVFSRKKFEKTTMGFSYIVSSDLNAMICGIWSILIHKTLFKSIGSFTVRLSSLGSSLLRVLQRVNQQWPAAQVQLLVHFLQLSHSSVRFYSILDTGVNHLWQVHQRRLPEPV